jgi:Flp pilus assembly protein TadD
MTTGLAPICLLFLLPAQELSTAITALEQGRLEEAATVLSEIVHGRPHDPDANYYLGLTRFRQGRPREALPFLERATRLSPANPSAWKVSGLVFLGDKDFQRASAALERACALEREDEDSCYLFARSLFLSGRYQEAVPPFEQALRVAPPEKKGVVHRALALDLDEIGAASEAEAHFRNAVAVYRRTAALQPDPRVDYGAFLIRQGRAGDAVDTLRKAAAEFPMAARPHAELGRALLELNRPKEALAPLEKAVKLEPNGWAVRLLLGKAYARVGRTEEGERQMRLGREGWGRQGYGSSKSK